MSIDECTNTYADLDKVGHLNCLEEWLQSEKEAKAKGGKMIDHWPWSMLKIRILFFLLQNAFKCKSVRLIYFLEHTCTCTCYFEIIYLDLVCYLLSSKRERRNVCRWFDWYKKKHHIIYFESTSLMYRIHYRLFWWLI